MLFGSHDRLEHLPSLRHLCLLLYNDLNTGRSLLVYVLLVGDFSLCLIRSDFVSWCSFCRGLLNIEITIRNLVSLFSEMLTETDS